MDVSFILSIVECRKWTQQQLMACNRVERAISAPTGTSQTGRLPHQIVACGRL
jgi:hypothetical protein